MNPVLTLIRQVLGRLLPDGPREPPSERMPPPQPDHRLTPVHLHAVFDHLRPDARSGSAPDLAHLLQMLDGLTPPLTAADVMTKAPIAVPPLADWRKLTAVFTEHTFRALPVVDAQNHLLGMVPATLLLRPGASGLTAAHLMQPAPGVPSDATLSDLLTAFAAPDQSVLPIVSKGTLVGVLTRTDLIAALFRTL